MGPKDYSWQDIDISSITTNIHMHQRQMTETEIERHTAETQGREPNGKYGIGIYRGIG